jgi:hypothetical protein
VNEEVIRPIDGAREHDVGLARLQSIARGLDRIERARAGRIEAEGVSTEFESLGDSHRGQARHKAMLWVACIFSISPDRLREARHAFRRKRQIAKHNTCTCSRDGLNRCESLSGAVQQPLGKRLHPGHAFCCDGKPSGVEHVRESGHVTASLRPGLIGTSRRIVGQYVAVL